MLNQIDIKLSTFDWSGVSGVAEVLMVLLTVLLLYGLKQGSRNIKESSLSREAEILRWAMEEMDKLKPQIKLLTDAHKRLPYCNCDIGYSHSDEFISDWNEEELKAAHAVSITMQRIGYMAYNNLISKDHFMNLWGPMYLSIWYSLERWIKHKRIELKEPLEIKDGAYSRKYLEEYALYCESNLDSRLVNNERLRFNLEVVPTENKWRKRTRTYIQPLIKFRDFFKK